MCLEYCSSISLVSFTTYINLPRANLILLQIGIKTNAPMYVCTRPPSPPWPPRVDEIIFKKLDGGLDKVLDT